MDYSHSLKPLVLGGALDSAGTEIAKISERRKALRYPFTATAVVTEVRSEARVAGRSSDLGTGGCYIDTLSPFSVGAVVRVRIDREPRHFEAMAKVVYGHPTMGMGLAFTKIEPEHEKVLTDWVTESSGGQVCESKTEAAGSRPETPAIAQPEGADLQQTVSDLIKLMLRRKLISENEGAALLSRFSR